MREDRHKIVVAESDSSLTISAGGMAQHESGTFDLQRIEASAFASSEPLVRDMLGLACAVEFADRIIKRKSGKRLFQLHMPVYEYSSWDSNAVVRSLTRALNILTGDDWSFRYERRASSPPRISQRHLPLSPRTEAVLPFSDGLDSLAVSGLMGAELEGGLLCIRVKRGRGVQRCEGRTVAEVPYRITYTGHSGKEPTFRSRAFKFIIVTAAAAHQHGVSKIVLPESGQTALGLWLTPIGDHHPISGSHPQFVWHMNRFLNALLNAEFNLHQPRLWNTKGETLGEYRCQCSNEDWAHTKSCWKPNHQSSVNGKWHHCGVCAACLLRRQSLHAAGLEEPADSYLCGNLDSPELEAALQPAFRDSIANGPAFTSHASFGVESMDSLAELGRRGSQERFRRYARELHRYVGLDEGLVEQRLSRLVRQHHVEWTQFLTCLHRDSFIRKWVDRK